MKFQCWEGRDRRIPGAWWTARPILINIKFRDVSQNGRHSERHPASTDMCAYANMHTTPMHYRNYRAKFEKGKTQFYHYFIYTYIYCVYMAKKTLNTIKKYNINA